MEHTNALYDTATKLSRIARLSGNDRSMKFGHLMHHYNIESLTECFNQLDGKKAVGTDGVNKEEYGKNLNRNLEKLIEKMKRMGYRPGAVRKVLIPKEGNPGAKRPLGIGNFEDKIVQKMTQRILESIYEPLFLDSSYGFRVGKGCHDAIKDLHNYLFRNEVETVIDVDLKNFFGMIDHQLLEGMLREKISDEKFIRYIIRMFKAGVLSDGEMTVSDEGVPQGSPCSPILANVFAHHVIDTWFETMVKPNCVSKVELFRYADDVVICCETEADAHRIKVGLGKRLEKYKLEMNSEKTKLVAFSKRKARLGIRQGTFDFLGFTFYYGKSRQGQMIPKVKTSSKRIKGKLKRVKEWIRDVRSWMPKKEIWKRFCSKIRGHTQYYGVSFNIQQVNYFIYRSVKIVFKWINRRSQRKSMNWEGFKAFLKAYPTPKAKVFHPLF